MSLDKYEGYKAEKQNKIYSRVSDALPSASLKAHPNNDFAKTHSYVWLTLDGIIIKVYLLLRCSAPLWGCDYGDIPFGDNPQCLQLVVAASGRSLVSITQPDAL